MCTPNPTLKITSAHSLKREWWEDKNIVQKKQLRQCCIPKSLPQSLNFNGIEILKFYLLMSILTTPQDANKKLVVQVYLCSNTCEFSALVGFRKTKDLK